MSTKTSELLTGANINPADIRWDDQGQPKSHEFDDFYFNTDSGIDESRFVFVQPSNLQQRGKNTAAVLL